jgi:hypothetical protein
MGKSNAEEILARAEKKASSSVGWFGSQSSKWEEAGDLFAQVSHTWSEPRCVGDELGAWRKGEMGGSPVGGSMLLDGGAIAW